MGGGQRRRAVSDNQRRAQWTDRTLICSRTCSRAADLIKIRFTDAKTGWIVGERGSIFRTTDAGFTWTEMDSTIKTALYGLSFPDASHGWAAGERGTILQLSIK
ncbi:MAG TPA: YCF48-related protein [Nitrospirales bacterium]|nr:YCF48-related protein [Nitrospirales bacterium]